MAILGAAAGGAFPQLTITQSMTWVPPMDGNICIHVVGAGGSGQGHSQYAPHGGGGGAYGKVPSLAVTTSGSFTLVVGVGGVSQGAGNVGLIGGSSTIAGTGLTGTKTCGGGGPGTTSFSVGGTVSGSGEGWVGYAGGAGRLGGGAVGVHGTGEQGGTATHKTGGMTDAASGGLGMSGFGIICGGSQKSYCNDWQAAAQPSVVHGMAFPAGDLCGGGSAYGTEGYRFYRGSDGGIGGGGGGGQSATGWGAGNPYSFSGAGGDGIILIQYLPW